MGICCIVFNTADILMNMCNRRVNHFFLKDFLIVEEGIISLNISDALNTSFPIKMCRVGCISLWAIPAHATTVLLLCLGAD